MQPQNTPARRERPGSGAFIFSGLLSLSPSKPGPPRRNPLCGKFYLRAIQTKQTPADGGHKESTLKQNFICTGRPEGRFAEHLSLIRIASGATRAERPPGGCPSSREQGIPSDLALLYVASFRSSRFLLGNKTVRQIKVSSVLRFSSCLASLFPVYRTFKDLPA